MFDRVLSVGSTYFFLFFQGKWVHIRILRMYST
jgi:hypothetical protein